MVIWNYLGELWPYVAGLVDLGASIVATGHVVLYKRDTRAAIAWVGLIWLVPLLGSVLYLILGINRIERKAHWRRVRRLPVELTDDTFDAATDTELVRKQFGLIGGDPILTGSQFTPLARLIGELTQRPLLSGNDIEPFVNGDEAYPAMRQAIEDASESVNLSTYIFDNDRAGGEFLEALKRANDRGVEVRVLIDDVGARYSWPSMAKSLHRAGIRVARFMPTTLPWRFRYSNLRSHRKIMVVDSRVGFTGGMNIREGNCLELGTGYPVQDIHFRVEGPVVAHLQEVFVEDWAFATGEELKGDEWFPDLPEAGKVLARGIADGPDEDFDKLRLAILGALAAAQASVTIVTPYFLPDASLITALNIAAMRGVAIDIVLPEVGNLVLVQWAATAHYAQVLEGGCRIWHSPAPFDHTKLMLVDGVWTLLGSANWDPRSLRLNFEVNVECYDRELTGRLSRLAQKKIQRSKRVTLREMQARPLPIQLRDGLARLLSPYL